MNRGRYSADGRPADVGDRFAIAAAPPPAPVTRLRRVARGEAQGRRRGGVGGEGAEGGKRGADAEETADLGGGDAVGGGNGGIGNEGGGTGAETSAVDIGIVGM